jgi:hypothetical protein
MDGYLANHYVTDVVQYGAVSDPICIRIFYWLRNRWDLQNDRSKICFSRFSRMCAWHVAAERKHSSLLSARHLATLVTRVANFWVEDAC